MAIKCRKQRAFAPLDQVRKGKPCYLLEFRSSGTVVWWADILFMSFKAERRKEGVTVFPQLYDFEIAGSPIFKAVVHILNEKEKKAAKTLVWLPSKQIVQRC